MRLSYGRLMHFRSLATRALFSFLTCCAALLITACEPGSEAISDQPVSSSPAAATAPNPTAAAAEASAANPSLPQEELATIFEATPGLLAEARTPAVFSQFRPVQQAQLIPTGDKLRITATGDDPQVLLPAFIQGKQFIIQATIDSPADTFVQMYYLRPGQTTYTEAQSQQAPLVKGRNVVYLRFTATGMVDPLRLDIGAARGDYVIESMVARALPAPAP